MVAEVEAERGGFSLSAEAEADEGAPGEALTEALAGLMGVARASLGGPALLLRLPVDDDGDDDATAAVAATACGAAVADTGAAAAVPADTLLAALPPDDPDPPRELLRVSLGGNFVPVPADTRAVFVALREARSAGCGAAGASEAGASEAAPLPEAPLPEELRPPVAAAAGLAPGTAAAGEPRLAAALDEEAGDTGSDDRAELDPGLDTAGERRTAERGADTGRSATAAAAAFESPPPPPPPPPPLKARWDPLPPETGGAAAAVADCPRRAETAGEALPSPARRAASAAAEVDTALLKAGRLGLLFTAAGALDSSAASAFFSRCGLLGGVAADASDGASVAGPGVSAASGGASAASEAGADVTARFGPDE